MRSVVVVLPASMWAMMPMLRTHSRGNGRFPVSVFDVAACATFCLYPFTRRADHPTRRNGELHVLPAVVSEGLVGLGHAQEIFLLLHGHTGAVESVEQLARQPFGHALLTTNAAVGDEPPHRQRIRAARGHFDRHLVVGATHAPRLDFQRRPDVLDRFLQLRDRVLTGAFAHDVESSVHYLLGRRFLAVEHEPVGDLSHQPVPVYRIRLDLALLRLNPASHLQPPSRSTWAP